MTFLLTLFAAIAAAAPPAPGVGLVAHELTATPPLTDEAVWKGLVAGQAALLSCVGDPAAPLPTTIRALDLRWAVAPGGAASGLSVEGAEPAGPGLKPCLEAAIGGVRWADPGAAPATLTARLVLLHNAYTTLTRAPASMLPPRTPGDNVNAPAGILGSLKPSGHSVQVEATVLKGDIDATAAVAQARAMEAELSACYRLRTEEGPTTVELLGTYKKDGTVKSVRPTGTAVGPVVICSEALLSTISVQEAGEVQWTVRHGADAAPANSAEAESPIILGSLDKSEIDVVIRRHMSGVRACYKEGLKAEAALAGKVVFRFTIAVDGSVGKAEVKSSTLRAPTVEDCMVQEFRRMTFPAPSGGGIVIVSYPFVFNPG